MYAGIWPQSGKLERIVDTFNFSFFEDKPEDASHAPGEAAASAQPDAPHSESLPAPASSEEKDPFDFSDLDFAPDPLAPDAFSLDEPTAPAPSTSTPLEAGALELDPNAHLTVNDAFTPAAQAEFPDLDLAPEPQDPLNFDPLAFDALDFSPSQSATEASAPNPESAPAVESPSTLSLEPAPELEPALSIEPAPTLPEVPSPLSEPVVAAVSASQPLGASTPNPTISEPPRRRYLTQDEPFGEVAPRRDRLRIAILGASGIGFNHASWLDKHAGDIVGFLGSSEDTIANTAQKLAVELGHAVPGFSDLETLLSQTQPQAVCVASPPALHFGQALACLEAGAHVLCEKPLVYITGRSKRENLDGARELLKTATKKNLVLASQLQYGAATPILCRLAGVTPFEVGDFAMELETANPRASRDPKELWVDLGPHPLSVAQFLAGENAELAEETLQVLPVRSESSTEISVRFGVRGEGGRLLMCRAIVRAFDRSGEAREPRRRFAFNGRVVQYNGVRMTDGTYIAQYISPDGYISHYPDPVDFLVGNFVRSCWNDDQLVINPAQGVQNLDWLLSISDKI